MPKLFQSDILIIVVEPVFLWDHCKHAAQLWSASKQSDPVKTYLFLSHGGQAGRRARGHGRDTHLSSHLAHAAGCHGDIVEVHAIAIVHVGVSLLGELWWCLLLWEHTGETAGKGRRSVRHRVRCDTADAFIFLAKSVGSNANILLGCSVWHPVSSIGCPYLLPPMLPCGQPFMSGEPWKAAFPWPCCIIGDCVWVMRGESRGLWGVPGPPKPPSACWLIPVVDASKQVSQTQPAETQLIKANALGEESVTILCNLPHKDKLLQKKKALWRCVWLSTLVCIHDYGQT